MTVETSALNSRLARRMADLRAVQRATPSIVEMNESLDRLLATEQRPSERLRMLRETTNQITRVANDAIQAYRRARATVDAELQMPTGAHAQAERIRGELDAARDEVLAALRTTSHRYAWAEPWPPVASSAVDGESDATAPGPGDSDSAGKSPKDAEHS